MTESGLRGMTPIKLSLLEVCLFAFDNNARDERGLLLLIGTTSTERRLEAFWGIRGRLVGCAVAGTTCSVRRLDAFWGITGHLVG